MSEPTPAVTGVGLFLVRPCCLGRRLRGGGVEGRDLSDRVGDLLQRVGLNAAHMNRYPHAFSGGERQRIGIARALALEPQLMMLDEPVSALDVSVRAQILNLLLDLQQETGMTYVIVAHDLSVLERICDLIAVVYLGQIMELAESRQLFGAPRHPYTQSLLSAIPIAEPRARTERQILEGDTPNPADSPGGCKFSGAARWWRRAVATRSRRCGRWGKPASFAVTSWATTAARRLDREHRRRPGRPSPPRRGIDRHRGNGPGRLPVAEAAGPRTRRRIDAVPLLSEGRRRLPVRGREQRVRPRRADRGTTAYTPPPAVAERPAAELPHWWTDDPSPEAAEGPHHGAGTVNRWREDFLGDFAERMLRCSSPKR